MGRSRLLALLLASGAAVSAPASALPILSDFTSTLTEEMPKTAPVTPEEERSRSDPGAKMIL